MKNLVEKVKRENNWIKLNTGTENLILYLKGTKRIIGKIIYLNDKTIIVAKISEIEHNIHIPETKDMDILEKHWEMQMNKLLLEIFYE